MRVIKTNIKKITFPSIQNRICDIVDRTNRIMINTYQFIKLYVLDQYELFNRIPVLDDNFILCCFSTVGFCSDPRRKPTVTKNLREELNLFYESKFRNIHKDKIDIRNMSQILRYQTTDILTNIGNNITLNFDKYLKNLMFMWCKKSDVRIIRKYVNDTVAKIMLQTGKSEKIAVHMSVIEKLHTIQKLMEIKETLRATNERYIDILDDIEKNNIFDAQEDKVSFSKYKGIELYSNEENELFEQINDQINDITTKAMLQKINFTSTMRKLGNKISKLDIAEEKIRQKLEKFVVHVQSDSLIQTSNSNLLDTYRYEDLSCWLGKIVNKKNNYHLRMTYCAMGICIVKEFLPKILSDKPIVYQVKVKETHNKFLLYMIKINREVEQYNNGLSVKDNHLKQRLYQVIPQRTNVVPKYIPIDTKIVKDTLISYSKQQLKKKDTNDETYNKKNDANNKKNEENKEDTKESNSNATSNKENFWKQIFPKLYEPNNRKLLGSPNYVFNNLIYTDGYTVSVVQRERTEVRDQNYAIKKAKVSKKEPKNIDKLTKKQLDELGDYEIVGIDPGKRNILTMIDQNRNKLRYTGQQRQVECFHKATRKVLMLTKNINKNVGDQEKLISQTNCKSSFVESFSKYVSIKNDANDKELLKHYSIETYRKYKWKTHIHKQQSEAKLVNRIKEKYEKEKKVCIAYGNWSPVKQMPNNYPTPNIGIRKMLSKHFKVVLVDEYKTSKLCCTCYSENKNLGMNDNCGYYRKQSIQCPEGKIIQRTPPKSFRWGNRTIYSLLCCTNINCNKLYDRDVNGSCNILNIAINHIKNNKRLAQFERKSQ